MAGIRLDVPRVAQSRSMSCWYAAAAMVGYYYEQGPRLGLPQVWIDNTGIFPDKIAELARHESMSFLTAASHEFSPGTLISTIFKYGPIWAPGWWDGYGHVVVITGCAVTSGGANRVFINDPDGGVAREITVDILNTKRARGLLLVRNPRTIPNGHRHRFLSW